MLSDNKNIKLRPSQAPLLLPQSIFKVALFSLLLLGSLLGLAYLYWGLALLRKLKPFAEVHRRLKKTHSRSWDDKSYREALQSIHQAFNETAQKTVFAERLDEFFREHNKYQPLQQPITTYFTHSRKYFFDPVKDNHRFEYSRSDLMNLVEACRDIERGLA
jgi:mxaA protein